MKLNLTKPLVVLDIESTGVVVGHDRIIELCLIKVMPDGSEQEMTVRVNPQMPIPEASTAIHGIRDEDVANEPTFKQLAPKILQFIDNADLCGYNSNKFDIPMLVEEFLRAEIDFPVNNRRFVDVQNIFHRMEPRTLKGAYKFYCNKDLLDAHTANADTRATLEVLKAQLDFYKDVPYQDKDGKMSYPVQNDVKALADFSAQGNWADMVGHIVYDSNHKECFNFGKHKGKTLEEVFRIEPAYYAWMMNSDFPLTTKRLITEVRMRAMTKNNSL